MGQVVADEEGRRVQTPRWKTGQRPFPHTIRLSTVATISDRAQGHIIRGRLYETPIAHQQVCTITPAGWSV